MKSISSQADEESRSPSRGATSKRSSTRRWRGDWKPILSHAWTIALASAILGAILGGASTWLSVQSSDRQFGLENEPKLRFTYFMLPQPDELLSSPRKLMGNDINWRVAASEEQLSQARATANDPYESLKVGVSCTSSECTRATQGEAIDVTLRSLYLLIENDGNFAAESLQLRLSSSHGLSREGTSMRDVLRSTGQGEERIEALGDLASGEGILVPLATLTIFDATLFPLNFVSIGSSQVPMQAEFHHVGSNGTTVVQEVRSPTNSQLLTPLGELAEAIGQ